MFSPVHSDFVPKPAVVVANITFHTPLHAPTYSYVYRRIPTDKNTFTCGHTRVRIMFEYYPVGKP